MYDTAAGTVVHVNTTDPFTPTADVVSFDAIVSPAELTAVSTQKYVPAENEPPPDVFVPGTVAAPELDPVSK